MTLTADARPDGAPAAPDGDSACRAMAGGLTVVTTGPVGGPGPHAATSVHVEETELVFDGHYPGFPILPGVCLIECAHRTAVATAAAVGLPAGLRLHGVDSARFLDPVYPDETVTVELTWKQDGADWQGRVTLRTDRAESARIRLRYRAGPPGGADGPEPR